MDFYWDTMVLISLHTTYGSYLAGESEQFNKDRGPQNLKYLLFWLDIRKSRDMHRKQSSVFIAF